MRNKLSAIWIILTSNHYLLLGGRGAVVGRYPKNIEQLQLMKNMAEKFKDKESDGDG